MPEKWTEIDGEIDGEGEERGIAGIPARTGHTENRKQEIPRSTRERGIFLFEICHLTFPIRHPTKFLAHPLFFLQIRYFNTNIWYVF